MHCIMYYVLFKSRVVERGMCTCVCLGEWMGKKKNVVMGIIFIHRTVRGTGVARSVERLTVDLS